MQCWFWWSHGFGTQGHISAWHCTLLYQPISSSEANSGIPDTAVLHRRMDLDWHRVSSDPFKRERDRTIHKFLGTCGGKYHSDNHQRNQSYGERPSLLLVWLISLGKKRWAFRSKPHCQVQYTSLFWGQIVDESSLLGFFVYFPFLFRA